VTVLKAYDGRSAIEATVEPSVTVSRNQGAKIPERRRLPGWRAAIGLRDGAARGTPYTYRRKKRKKERRIEPVQHWRRCGSAWVLNWVGIGADVGAAAGVACSWPAH
jgi:hypothetical protein